MYDPLVVDAFIRAFPEIAPAATKAGQEARTIFPTEGQFTTPIDSSRSLRQIRANATEAALLAEFSQDVGRAGSTFEVFEHAAQCLRKLIPATVFALYRYRPESDSLVCESSAGDVEKLLNGLTIRAGQRVTGWCGATQRPALNSDAALDLTHIADMFQPALRSTLSVPLISGDRLVGVLTAYASREQAFNESHTYIAEQVAISLTEKLMSSASTRSVVSFNPRTKTS
jgi:GAF domain-containing protein